MTYRIKRGEQPTTTQCWEHLFKAVPIDSLQDENEVLLQRVTKYLDGSTYVAAVEFICSRHKMEKLLLKVRLQRAGVCFLMRSGHWSASETCKDQLKYRGRTKNRR